MHPFFGCKSVIGWARLGWRLPKCFGKSWWQWNAVWWGRCTCSWLGRKYTVFLASRMRFMNIYMWYKQYYNRKIHGAYSSRTSQNALISHVGSTIWQNICTHFLVARVWSAGLGWAGDYQNVLGKVGGSEMQFGRVDVHALDSGENTQCFLASLMRFMNIYMRYKQYYKRKYTVHTALSLRKMPWYRTAEALSGKIYAPIFWLQQRDRLGSAGLAITKMFWEKLVAVKCSLVGSMYMLLNRVKIHSVFLASRMRFMNIYMRYKQYYKRKYTVHTALSLRKMPWYRTAEALSGKIYAPIFWLQQCDRLGSAGLAITKMFWEKLVAVKCSLVGSMYMLLTRAKIHSVFGISNAFYEHLHAIYAVL